MSDSNEEGFRSITGQLESAEPALAPPNQASVAPQDTAPTSNRTTASALDQDNGLPSSAKNHPRRGPRSSVISGEASTTNSPLSSRDNSPHRPTQRQKPPTSAAMQKKSGLPSRKSSTDVSPNRGPALQGSTTSVPSAAAIQRALSSANIPQLPPISAQDPSRVPRPQKAPSGSNSGDSTPHWPISPRLKSPPPDTEGRSRSRRNSLRTQAKKTTPTQTTPSIIVQSSSPAPTSRILVKDDAISDSEEQPILTMKGSTRGPSGAAPKLETVQEASLPTTPAFDDLAAQSVSLSSHPTRCVDEDEHSTGKITEDLSTTSARHTESGSDSGANRNERKEKSPVKRSSSAQRPNMTSKPSYSSLSTIKSRAEVSSNNMTVETETVPSIPQPTIGVGQDRSGSGRIDASGSVRLKPSNETIRPKKEKPKPKRKAPSVHSGTASSKADVFEAKVANAIDQTNSSDSDETFVYESNPPDPPVHRSRHHHSRTPSMTSITSLADPRTAIRDTHRTAGKKSSMKFANNPYNNPNSDPDAHDRGEGTIRAGPGRAGGGSYHHHIPRGQMRGGLNQTHFPGGDSSDPQVTSIRGPSSRNPSQPASPRFQTFRVQNGNGSNRKHGEFSSYDIDSAGVADDERTPLIANSRAPRSRTSRRPGSGSLRQLEHQRRRNGGGFFRRCAGCLVLSTLLLVLMFSAVGLIFATTKPLYGVKVREIQNVIATPEEIMLDLLVDAVNPNIIGITIADMDVNIFAKSKHVGSDKWWREHGGRHGNQEDWGSISEDSPLELESESGPTDITSKDIVRAADGVDEGTDPIDDPRVGEPRTMLLGRIFHFDSPLSFDGSFFKHHAVESLGELRLTRPGNKTEAGGAERWEEVLQYPFELILRGVFRYQLPLSTRDHTVPITATYYYEPDKEKKKKAAVGVNGEAGVVRIEKSWGRWDARARLRERS